MEYRNTAFQIQRCQLKHTTNYNLQLLYSTAVYAIIHHTQDRFQGLKLRVSCSSYCAKVLQGRASIMSLNNHHTGQASVSVVSHVLCCLSICSEQQIQILYTRVEMVAMERTTAWFGQQNKAQ